MTQGVLEVVTFDRRLVAVLAAIPLDTGWGRAPVEIPPNVAPDKPYCILDAIEGGEFDGPPLATPDSCASVLRQVTAVGKTADQATLVMDRIRRTLLGRNGSGSFLVSLDTVTVKCAGRRSLGDGPTDSDQRLTQKVETFEFYLEAI